MKKIIAKVKALFTKKETPVIAPEAIVEDTYVPPVVIQEVKKTPTKRKPGPKKQVPGEPAIKKSNRPTTGTPKRTSKPKPKV
jgi:hypothetical protein